MTEECIHTHQSSTNQHWIMAFLRLIMCVTLITYGVVKIDGRFLADDDDISTMDDDYQPTILRTGTALAILTLIQKLPVKEIMETSVNKFDPDLKQAFYQIYERSDKDEREAIEYTVALATLKNCNKLKVPFKTEEKEVNNLLDKVMHVKFDLMVFGSSKEDKKVFQKAQKQIKTNGPALCQEVGK